jgi:fatty-acyl-CoA synthase
MTEKRTLGSLLEENLEKRPDRMAVAFKNEETSYVELHDKANAFARGLFKLGVRKGDKVGLWMPNRVEWVIAYFGITTLGAVVVPMNTRYKTHEADYILNDSESVALVTVDEFLGIDFIEMIGKLDVSTLKHVIIDGKPGEGMKSFEGVLELGKDWKQDQEFLKTKESVDPEEVCFILYTSGTTGKPKGAMLSHHNITKNAIDADKVMKVTEKDNFLIPVPFFHCFGCVLGITMAAAAGSGMVPMDVFKADDALDLIEKYECSIVHGVPTMFVLELEEQAKKKRDLSSLRTGIMAGAPCPVEVVKAVRTKMGCDICIGYGLTEASPLITLTSTDDTDEIKAETVGKCIPNVEVKIVDDEHEPLPPGKMGELACKGYNVMKGYYKMPDKTAETIDDQGWLYTGDLATMDDKGYVKIVGRKKDMIITGGFNVYPREIEEYLFTHPKIQNVSVIGVPDDVMGEVGWAFIIPKPGEQVTEKEMKEFCKGDIANFKVPRKFVFVESMPMTQSGKVQKFKLREIANQMRDEKE